MKIVPRDPWFGMDNFFDDLFAHRHLIGDSDSFQPRVDIIEKEDQYVFVAELPGVKKEDISVNLQNGVLTLEAKVDEDKTEETDRMIRRERRTGFFSRSINVGEDIDAEQIKAEFTNGLLKLTAPKPQKSSKEIRKIEIL